MSDDCQRKKIAPKDGPTFRAAVDGEGRRLPLTRIFFPSLQRERASQVNDRATWLALAARCEAATDDDRDIGVAILKAAGWRNCADQHGDLLWHDSRGVPILHFCTPTASLDHIVVLIERELSGWAWKCGTCAVSDDAWLCPDYNSPIHGARLRAELGEPSGQDDWRDAGIDIDRRPPGNVALAMCAAFCRAMAAIAQEPRE